MTSRHDSASSSCHCPRADVGPRHGRLVFGTVSAGAFSSEYWPAIFPDENPPRAGASATTGLPTSEKRSAATALTWPLRPREAANSVATTGCPNAMHSYVLTGSRSSAKGVDAVGHDGPSGRACTAER
jgi:hypothetical protein